MVSSCTRWEAPSMWRRKVQCDMKYWFMAVRQRKM